LDLFGFWVCGWGGEALTTKKVGQKFYQPENDKFSPVFLRKFIAKESQRTRKGERSKEQG
jgi:hypothetical protein